MGRKLKTRNTRFSAGMILIAVGIVYGDIATSPMYVMKSILAGNGGITNVDKDFIIGSLSLVIWTVTLITTVKYVLIALKADNQGEGGIFALYSLVKRCGKWLIIPAMIGGSAILADGVLTPAVTVTTSVEGLRAIPAMNDFLGTGQLAIIVIVLAIITILFCLQKSGTSIIGRIFGPFMTIWFIFLAIAGLICLTQNFEVLKALNPIYAIDVLMSPNNMAGFMILGSVFLATTGAEALYADIGHVGKKSIYISWPFVKICLIINYLGQGAWILANAGNAELAAIPDMNPFYKMLPDQLMIVGIVLGAMAAVIASQALITGSFSIVSEAIKLNLLPHMKIFYPSEKKGQLYIPLVNWLLWLGCVIAVLHFETSARMEGAYGLAITITLLTTSILLITWMVKVRKLRICAILYAVIFMPLELIFFLSCLGKFLHGGYFAVIIAFLILTIMLCWHRGTEIERKQYVYLNIKDYIDKLRDLKDDTALPRLATNLICLTQSRSRKKIEMDILYTLLDRDPKRADRYWFVNMQVTDQPYGAQYWVENFDTDFLYRVNFRLGFKEEERLNVYMRQVFADLIESGELPEHHAKHTIYLNERHARKLHHYTPINIGSIKYCIIRKSFNPSSDLSELDKFALTWKYYIRSIVGTPDKWYEIEPSTLIVEYVPLFIKERMHKPLKRIT